MGVTVDHIFSATGEKSQDQCLPFATEEPRKSPLKAQTWPVRNGRVIVCYSESTKRNNHEGGVSSFGLQAEEKCSVMIEILVSCNPLRHPSRRRVVLVIKRKGSKSRICKEILQSSAFFSGLATGSNKAATRHNQPERESLVARKTYGCNTRRQRNREELCIPVVLCLAMRFISVSKNFSTILPRGMRGLLHCVATVTICLVTKATHLWSIHFVKSVVLPVRTHQNHRSLANARTSYKTS